MKTIRPVVYAFSIPAIAAAALACGESSPPSAPEDPTAAPTKSIYAADGAATGPGTTAEATPRSTYDASASPKVVSDGGTTKGDSGDAGACQALSVCCAQQKACAEETAACDAVVHTDDSVQCVQTLAGYQVIGCAHDDSASPELPNFQGCDGYY